MKLQQKILFLAFIFLSFRFLVDISLSFLPLLLVFLFLLLFIYQWQRYEKNKEFKKLKDEITWEKEKVIRVTPSLMQMVKDSKKLNFLSLLLVIALSSFLFLGVMNEISERNSSTLNNQSFYFLQMNEKIFYREERLSHFNLKKVNNKEDMIYYTDAISLKDLQQILEEERIKLSAVLNEPIEKVEIFLDKENEFCTNKEAVACYFNNKIFIIPQKMKSKSYYRKLIRHELIHHLEEKIALKYETQNLKFE